MCPEYGATIGFFPVDEMSMKYLQQSARDPHRVSCAREYLKAVGMFRDYTDSNQDPVFSEVCVDCNAVFPVMRKWIECTCTYMVW